MKIVIDIPQIAYEITKINVETGNLLCPISEKEIVIAIAKGVSLPDRHGRLIDENVLRDGLHDSYLDSFGLMRVEKVLENMNAIIEADGGDTK